MTTIAIIGGIGSGKSTATKILQDMGYTVFDCDKIYKEVSQTQEYLELVEKTFPNSVKNGKLDREYLGQLVFSNKEKLRLLNSIAHPLVLKNLNEKISKLKEDKVFVEVQSLDNDILSSFDKVLYVAADTKFRIQRVLLRNNYTKEHVKRIIAAQPSDDKMEEFADYIVLNNKGENELKMQLIKVLNL